LAQGTGGASRLRGLTLSSKAETKIDCRDDDRPGYFFPTWRAANEASDVATVVVLEHAIATHAAADIANGLYKPEALPILMFQTVVAVGTPERSGG